MTQPILIAFVDVELSGRVKGYADATPDGRTWAAGVHTFTPGQARPCRPVCSGPGRAWRAAELLAEHGPTVELPVLWSRELSDVSARLAAEPDRPVLLLVHRRNGDWPKLLATFKWRPEQLALVVYSNDSDCLPITPDSADYAALQMFNAACVLTPMLFKDFLPLAIEAVVCQPGVLPDLRALYQVLEIRQKLAEQLRKLGEYVARAVESPTEYHRNRASALASQIRQTGHGWAEAGSVAGVSLDDAQRQALDALADGPVLAANGAQTLNAVQRLARGPNLLPTFAKSGWASLRSEVSHTRYGNAVRRVVQDQSRWPAVRAKLLGQWRTSAESITEWTQAVTDRWDDARGAIDHLAGELVALGPGDCVDLPDADRRARWAARARTLCDAVNGLMREVNPDITAPASATQIDVRLAALADAAEKLQSHLHGDGLSDENLHA